MEWVLLVISIFVMGFFFKAPKEMFQISFALIVMGAIIIFAIVVSR